MTHISMYRKLPKASRDYVRSIKHKDKAMQNCLRMFWIDYEWFETQAMADHECGQKYCDH